MLQADESGDAPEALELYTSAAEHLLAALRLEDDEVGGAAIRQRLAAVMDRAEQLKETGQSLATATGKPSATNGGQGVAGAAGLAAGAGAAKVSAAGAKASSTDSVASEAARAAAALAAGTPALPTGGGPLAVGALAGTGGTASGGTGGGTGGMASGAAVSGAIGGASSGKGGTRGAAVSGAISASGGRADGGTDKSRLTDAEKRVLARSSRIGRLLHYPWIYGEHAHERFSFPFPWEDPDGLLALNKEQKSNFGQWARPSAYMRGEPTMIYLVSPLTITQTVITDCSFVSSLVIAAAYERRFRRKLITAILHPQVRTRPIPTHCSHYFPITHTDSHHRLQLRLIAGHCGGL
jgi:hypothetical protein